MKQKKCGQHGLPALQNESPSRNVYTNSLSEIEVRTSFSAFSIALIIRRKAFSIP